MKALRTAVGLAAALLSAGGYFASQWSYFSGSTARYVAQLDASPVPLVALVVLVTAVALSFVPDQEPRT
ncbi:MAG: hypothetical protein JST30_00790 [Armatimonadetes bacterium]|nr:hypothetical protein [Armatimonadota bacterium]